MGLSANSTTRILGSAESSPPAVADAHPMGQAGSIAAAGSNLAELTRPDFPCSPRRPAWASP
jgi:hypothetical protein